MSTEIVKPDWENLELAIMGQAEFTADIVDADQVAAQFANRLKVAETEDDIFGEDKPLGADDVGDMPFFVDGVRFAPSDKEGEGSKVYAIIAARRVDNGEPFLITCGGQKVLLRLMASAQRGLYPMEKPKRFTKADTSRKRTVLDLVNA